VRSSTLSDQSGHKMQMHACACNSSYQVLTLTLYGQAEGTLVPALCLILPNIFQYSNSGHGLIPTCWGPARAAPLLVAWPATEHSYQCALRGRGWQRGQLKEDRFMNESRLITVAHRPHGCPSRP